jgi:hypothetical protein
MPRGPKGEKRPADVIGNAVHVMRIATGEIEEYSRKRQGARGRLEGREGPREETYCQAPRGNRTQGRISALGRAKQVARVNHLLRQI